ncbi:hypothetical protein B0O99DRAFT_317828 [Bisporella sp. PMI_857]|nr:hypothetical protein B0O99DRAFT_317828 [Bisporella sp. PMI_857]
MHSQTILHLVPDKGNLKAISVLAHPDNEKYVSLSSPRPHREGGQDDKEDDGPKLGLEIGYHVPLRPRPEVIVEVGRNADLILPASSISSVHFSFETHPESKLIMFHDRSRHRNTKIDPFGFRTDGHIRQLVLQPGIIYKITAGGEKSDLYRFELRWAQMEEFDVLEKIECGYHVARERAQNPRWARTIEDGPTELSSWYNT